MGRVYAFAKAGNFHHLLFKISDNHLMGYNSFVSTPCHITVPHSSLRLEEMTYPRGADKYHSLAHQATHFVYIHVHKTPNHKLKKKKEGKRKTQLRHRRKRRIWVQNVKRGGNVFLKVVLKGKQYVT